MQRKGVEEMRNWNLELKKYDIGKHRYKELKNFCLQYPAWKDELKYKTDALKSPNLDKMPRGGGISDSTGDLATRRAELQSKCKMIEHTAEEAAGKELAEYIIENATHEDKGYYYLKTITGMPAGQGLFYNARRRFFEKLDKKHKVG